MGNREILNLCCPRCGHIDNDVPYAPSCGIITWKCPVCEGTLNLDTWEMTYDDIDHEMKLDYDPCG